MTTEGLNRIAFSIAYKHSPKKLRQLLDHYGSATEALQHAPHTITSEVMRQAEKEAAFIAQHQIQTYFYQDTNYPTRLSHCVDAPILLYSKGQLDVNPKHAISIVGTRTPSELGKDWCRKLVLDLASQIPNLTVISGLAYGIDIIAHRAAIEADIPTIIIPAHGLDRIYPSVHRNTAVQALNNGGIITEYPQGTTPEKYNFLARNRIIAGMADAVVVVESKKKGGSLITAQMAQDYNRNVYALPGRSSDVNAEGCNELIKRHQAQLITSAEDIITDMGWKKTTSPNRQTSMFELFGEISDTQQILLNKLHSAEDGWHINQLVMEVQMAYNTVASELMMLELNGLVKSMPGGMWRIVTHP